MNFFYSSLLAFSVVSFGATVFKATGGVIAGGTALTLLAQLGSQGHLLLQSYRRRRVVASVPDAEGKNWNVRGGFAAYARLVPSASDQGWGLEVPTQLGALKRRIVAEGADARWLAARIVPAITADGGNDKEIAAAVKRLEERGDPDQYLRWLAQNPQKRRDFMRRKDIVSGIRVAPGHAYDTLGVQGLDACLAVEMAVNEENERRALEGELAHLEEAWKEAEEIAVISDRLVLPAGVEARLSEIKRAKEHASD